MKILIEGGDLFEGDFDQFEDCFFSFRPEQRVSDEAKLQAIMEWCEEEGYKLEVQVDE